MPRLKNTHLTAFNGLPGLDELLPPPPAAPPLPARPGLPPAPPFRDELDFRRPDASLSGATESPAEDRRRRAKEEEDDGISRRPLEDARAGTGLRTAGSGHAEVDGDEPPPDGEGGGERSMGIGGRPVVFWFKRGGERVCVSKRERERDDVSLYGRLS